MISLEATLDRILADYGRGRDIDRMEPYRHPDKDAVICITQRLLRMVYPGYFREKDYRVYNARHSLSVLAEDVMNRLSQQIALLLEADASPGENCRQADALALEFLGQLPRIRERIQTDVEAAYDGDPAATSADEIIFCYPGLYAITVNRLAHGLHMLEVPMIPRIMTEYAHSLTGIDIHPGAVIGDHFFIDHGTGIVVGETTVIGNHVKIYQGVTLGGLSTRGGQSLRGTKRHPTIGDNVTIYANASILGGDTVIGRDSVIGANVFLTHSVPECTTVSIKSQELRFTPRPSAQNSEPREGGL